MHGWLSGGDVRVALATCSRCTDSVAIHVHCAVTSSRFLFAVRLLQCRATREPRISQSANVYSYWNCSQFPSLEPAARKYLSAPPTSVASEQLFSAASQIYVDRRSNLLGKNAEKLLFMAYNIRLFHYNYWLPWYTILLILSNETLVLWWYGCLYGCYFHEFYTWSIRCSLFIFGRKWQETFVFGFSQK